VCCEITTELQIVLAAWTTLWPTHFFLSRCNTSLARDLMQTAQMISYLARNVLLPAVAYSWMVPITILTNRLSTILRYYALSTLHFISLHHRFFSNSGRKQFTDECSPTRARMSVVKPALLNLNDGKILAKPVMPLLSHVGLRWAFWSIDILPNPVDLSYASLLRQFAYWLNRKT